CTGRTHVTGTYPRKAEVSEVLNEIGFFDSLDVRGPKLPDSFQRRTYVKVERQNRTVASVADDLLNCFLEEVVFTAEEQKSLHVALLECMDNVRQHAYV